VLTAVLYTLFAVLVWWSLANATIAPATNEITATLLPDLPHKKAVPLLPPPLTHLIRPHAESVSPPVFTIASAAPTRPSFGSDIDPQYADFTYMSCQPPELDALAKQLDRELCVQSTLVTNLAATGKALEAAAHAPVKISPGDPVSGDPAAITCRLDPERSDAELSAITCARNNYWAWWRAKWFNPSGISTTGPP